MIDDINNLDSRDEGLKAIFGERFHDETEPRVAVSKKETTTAAKTEKKAILKPRDAEWDTQPHERNQMEKLKACAKDALIFGGLSLLFFYFQQSGQMAMSASMPCICACCVLMGLGVGKNAR